MIVTKAKTMTILARSAWIVVTVGGVALAAGCGLIGYGDNVAPPPVACFPSIAIGEDHTCVVNRGGRVFCWGQTDHGQVTGSPGPGGLRSTPIEVMLPASASAVAAGPLTSCALVDGDVLYCWGARPAAVPPADFPEPRRVAFPADDPAYRIGLGQEFGCAKVGADDHVACWGTGATQRLGQADTVAHADPIAVPGPVGLAALAVGQRAACALQGDGAVWCWGDNRRGQLGLGVAEASRPPTVVADLAGIATLALGDDLACALAADALRCWGGNDLGQLGRGAVGPDQRVPGPGFATNVAAIAAMTSAACSLDLDGTVRCWGQNRSGELGQGDLAVRTTPTDVPILFGARSIAAGYHQACAEKDDKLWCWGDNLTGQLGRGSAALDSNLRPLGIGFRNVKGGGGTLCAIDAQFQLWCWGDGERGQAGLGGLRGAIAPTRIQPAGPPAAVREVAVGGVHACARGDTTVWCWGSNGAGQLGKPALGPGALTPEIIIDGASMTGLGVGSSHSCAIASGVLKCWGNNDFGQLGDGGTTPRPIPTVVPVTGPTRVALGGAHSCAIDNLGRLWCWGAGGAGQLGDGLGTASSNPVEVVHPQAWASLAAGRLHTCAVDQLANLLCWGDNAAGQLGSMGGATSTPRPVEWPQATGLVREVFIRQDTTCAVLTNGASRCWGADGFGALPPGGPSPRPFGSFTDFTSYGGGLYNLCAVRANGELWCAGAGDRGQLGADLVGWSPAPVDVPCD